MLGRGEYARRKAFAALVFALALAGCVALAACTTSGGASGGNGDTASSTGTGGSAAGNETYAGTLFDTSYVHTIDIAISDEDWADLRENPLEKTKYKVNVTIDSETIDEASFATKGNTSLSSVASKEDSNRYSFKINFGKYVEDQTYRGLDKLNLNNMYADATYMKDYLSYEIFRAMGVDAPLTSYVQLSINGEVLGLYLAIEDVDDSYLERVHDGEGELYKPETEMLGNMDKFGGKDVDGRRPQGFGNAGKASNSNENGSSDSGASAAPEPDVGAGASELADSNASADPGADANADGQDGSRGWSMPEGMNPPEGFEPPEGMELPEGMEPPEGMSFPGNGGGFGGFGGMFGSSDKGASLKYTDDELSSYSDIFDNAETGADEADEQRVVAALKQLSEGDVESSVDTDEVIRYFVAHNFVMSYDSYTGSMLHNYYLYENDGKLSMIPWDYNLAFGAFGGGGGGSFGGFGGKGGKGGSAEAPDTASDGSSTSAPAQNAEDAGSSANAMPSGFTGDGPSESAVSQSAESAAADSSGTAPKASSRDDATSVVNCGIDTPLSGAEEADRPMWAWITSDDEYLERYHELYGELLTSYFESGECQAEIERVRAMIAPYVEEDPSTFYTADEFETAVDTLEAFVEARAKSIRAQLDGALSTKTSEQDSAAKVDASGIKISAMGSQGGGR